MPQKKSSKKIKGVTIRFPLAELKELRAAAERDKRSLNAYIIRAAMSYTQQQLREQLDRAGH